VLETLERDEPLTAQEKRDAKAAAENRLMRSKIRVEIHRFFTREVFEMEDTAPRQVNMVEFSVFCGDMGHRAATEYRGGLPDQGALFRHWASQVGQHLRHMVFNEFEFAVAKHIFAR
jgi:hypothetical protein